MALAVVAALMGATVQSATGFGFALILSPALFASFEPYEAVTGTLVLGLLLNLLVLFDGRRLASVRWRLIAPPLAAAVPGLVLGVVVLEQLSQAVLQLLVGAVVLAIALQRLAGPRTPTVPGGRLSGAGTGLVSGTLTTSISVSGPPFVLWLERRGLAPAELRATLAAVFLALNLAGGVVLVIAGGLDRWLPLETLLPLLGLVLAGHYVGALVFRRLDAERFSVAVVALVAVAGLVSLTEGIAGL